MTVDDQKIEFDNETKWESYLLIKLQICFQYFIDLKNKCIFHHFHYVLRVILSVYV